MTQKRALAQVFNDENHAEFEWVQSELHRTMGDREQFVYEADHQKVRRTDRAIQTAEQHSNERDHIVYVNGDLPSCINHSNVDAYMSNTKEGPFRPGEQFTFEGYSVGAHNMHELDAGYDKPDRMVAYELKTKRGAYLGHSGRGDTTHVVPRGFATNVVGARKAKYERADGSIGQRWVVQLEETERE